MNSSSNLYSIVNECALFARNFLVALKRAICSPILQFCCNSNSQSEAMEDVRQFCLICMEPVNPSSLRIHADESCSLYCGHQFHLNCFIQFIASKENGEFAKCPCCRGVTGIRHLFPRPNPQTIQIPFRILDWSPDNSVRTRRRRRRENSRRRERSVREFNLEHLYM